MHAIYRCRTRVRAYLNTTSTRKAGAHARAAMASTTTKLAAFLGAVLLLLSPPTAVAQHHHQHHAPEGDPCRDANGDAAPGLLRHKDDPRRCSSQQRAAVAAAAPAR